MTSRRLTRRAFAVAALLLAGPSLAGNFRVTPVKLFLDRRARSASVTVTNDGAEPVTVQIDGRRWKQLGADGEDVYPPTDELVFFPKMATLPPGGERVIRIGLRGPPEAAEGTYRLFVRELPVVAPGEITVKLALNLGIPIFFQPSQLREEWQLQDASLSEERLQVRLRNSGTSHLVVQKLVATGTDDHGEVFVREAGGWYALSGGTRRFAIRVPREDCLKAKTIRIEATAGTTPREIRLAVDGAMCTPAPAPPEGRAPAD